MDPVSKKKNRDTLISLWSSESTCSTLCVHTDPLEVIWLATQHKRLKRRGLVALIRHFKQQVGQSHVGSTIGGLAAQISVSEGQMGADGGGGSARSEPTWHHRSWLMSCNRAPVGDHSELCNISGNTARRRVRTSSISVCCSFIYGCLQAGFTAGDWTESLVQYQEFKCVSISANPLLINLLERISCFCKGLFCSFRSHNVILAGFIGFNYVTSQYKLEAKKKESFRPANGNLHLLITTIREKLSRTFWQSKVQSVS